MGKMALLLYLARMAQQQGWIAVSAAAVPGMLEDLYEQAVRKASELVDLKKDVGARTGMSSGNVSTYKKRLLERGVIDEVGRGSFRFALPFMREYLQERFDFS